jgi:hypothetical protein
MVDLARWKLKSGVLIRVERIGYDGRFGAAKLDNEWVCTIPIQPEGSLERL